MVRPVFLSGENTRAASRAAHFVMLIHSCHIASVYATPAKTLPGSPDRPSTSDCSAHAVCQSAAPSGSAQSDRSELIVSALRSKLHTGGSRSSSAVIV